LGLSATTLWRAIKGLGLTGKKKVLRAAEQDRPHVARRREQWREAVPGLDPPHPLFLRETWAPADMSPPHAPSPPRTPPRMPPPPGPPRHPAGDARAARPLEDPHVRRRPAGRWPGGAAGGRRGDDRRAVRGLRPPAARPDAAARRRGGDGQPGVPQAGRRPRG